MILIITSAYLPAFADDVEADNQPRVLILRTLDFLRNDTNEVISGFHSVLDVRAGQYDVVDVHGNYLKDQQYCDGLKLSLKAMIDKGGTYDLVVLLREPAVRYALQIDELIGNTPVIFGMVENELVEAQLEEKYDVSGIYEPLLLRENILLADSIIEDLEKIIIVADESFNTSSMKLEIESEMDLFEDDYQIEFVLSDAFSQFENESILNESDHTMVYYLSRYDETVILGDYIANETVIFSPWRDMIMKNIVGGRVLDSKAYGAMLAKKSQVILSGASEKLPQYQNASSLYLFNRNKASMLNLDLKWIESESQFVNEVRTKDDDWKMVAGVGVIGVVLLAIALKFILTNRRKDSQACTLLDGYVNEIVENVDTAICIKDENRKYVHVNDKFKSLFDISGDLTERQDFDVFPYEFANQLKQIDDRATFGTDDYQKNLIYHHKEYGALYLEFKVKKIVKDNGTKHLVSYINDLTEQKKHEKTLAELNKLLEQQVRDRTGELIQAEKMAMLGTLVAGVSHEISTPIGVSITASTFLSDQTNHLKKEFESGTLKKSEMVGFLELLDETGEILFNNLNNAAEMITSFKKVAVDQSSEEIREFNLKDYSRGVVMNLKPKFKNTKYKVHVTGQDDIMMYSFPGAMNQILTNLILNSLIHGFENRESGEIRIDVTQRSDVMGVRIEYTDDGGGIPKEMVPKIFDPFYTTKRDTGGSGLGMNIVRNLVEKTLNGTIKVYSDTGDGVKFVLDLPQRINVYENTGNSDV